jgi:putative transposase
MRKVQFVNQNFYHIYNRGVEKRDIFLDQNDYIRFIHNLYEFNDIYPAPEYKRSTNVGSGTSHINRKRERLIDVVCFSLMPNHFHLLLKQIKENGITIFMRKLGTGYSNAFNLKNDRVGPLFQGTFKATHVNNDVHFTHISRYIHLNPLELREPRWKEAGIKDWSLADKFLSSYRWSSYLDFIGQSNFPSIINGRDFVLEYFNGDTNRYKNFLRGWTEKDIKDIDGLIFE